ncbi:RNA polymerase sigma factor [Chitinophaga nivalis]|uniref:RNA polymerase sigma-70 factor n=1 Tax=Chitinophaga nivalis TaxID=2991709 RepID=A0ABT3IQY1_9BACT|nr:RNA polymerase sigma-70 factor [Chitinophaga nivalis]MCW3463945.1 RNA polymerase sigma-70 factor [Chitinophaga nivalis]MCW3486365.1 RNA polymerase sigma-70 factor [Chitinophaga nivalis]
MPIQDYIFEDDATAASALQQGNTAALAYLYEKYCPLVYRFLYPYCHDQQLAEEIAQDAFVRLWDKRSKVNPALNCRNLLFTIARNLLTDHMRSVKNQPRLSGEVTFDTEPATETTYQSIILADLHKQTAAAIAQLPARSREVYTLSRQHHLTHKEIAYSLNISVKAVEKHLSIALKHLRVFCNKHLMEISIVTGILSL